MHFIFLYYMTVPSHWFEIVNDCISVSEGLSQFEVDI